MPTNLLLLDIREQSDELRQELLEGVVVDQLDALGVVLVRREGPASKPARQGLESVELERLSADQRHDRGQEVLVAARKVRRLLVTHRPGPRCAAGRLEARWWRGLLGSGC